MAPPDVKLKLPKTLIEQLGGQAISNGSRKFRAQISRRKEVRKAARVDKKSPRHGRPLNKRRKHHHHVANNNDDDISPTEISEKPLHLTKVRRSNPSPGPSPPKRILKPTKKADPVPQERRVISRSNLSPIPLRTVRNQKTEDDEEIAALEKKLGLKGSRKLPQSFKDDGLDELLEGLDRNEDYGEGYPAQLQRNAKAVDDEWLTRKRKKARKVARAVKLKAKEDEAILDRTNLDQDDSASDFSSLDNQGYSCDTSDEEMPDATDEDSLDTDDDFYGFSSKDSQSAKAPARIRENPYVAPAGQGSTPKYMPPSLRTLVSQDSDELGRLRRRIQGLINRVTESNLISILSDIESLYRDYPRQNVTSTLVDILLVSVCEPTSLPDTLIILPAGFIAAIYRVIGTDFGAQVVQRIVELFDEQYTHALSLSQAQAASATVDSSKETSNLIMLLSELYNFQVIGSNLIFDYVRMFLETLCELNAELLLKILRTSGPQLRQDDASSLKDIVAMLRHTVVCVGEANISVRTKFMIDMVNDLKNNRMRTGGAASAVTSEHTIRMKKIIGSLNNRTIRATEPLRIGLNDIQESEKKGKWWLVGASWSRDSKDEHNDLTVTKAERKKSMRAEDTKTLDLFQLARELRMNTDVRRAIFFTIMSATDYHDAYLRLLKLRLKKVQEYEIPKVLLRCAGSEESYNPYYTLIAKKLCSDRKLVMSFQYCLWDLFRRMGESKDGYEDSSDEHEELNMRYIVNLAKIFGTIIAEGSLSLSVLKNLNLRFLQRKTKIFVEVLLITLLLQTQRRSETKLDEISVSFIFAKVQVPALITGLTYFLKTVVSKTDIAGGPEQKATVKWACKIAISALRAQI